MWIVFTGVQCTRQPKAEKIFLNDTDKSTEKKYDGHDIYRHDTNLEIKVKDFILQCAK